MATPVEQLIVEIRAETKNLRKGLDEVNSKLRNTNKVVGNSLTGFKSLAKVFAAIGVVQLGKGVVNTARTFEDLEATMRAVTGSSENAALAMKTITDFTSTTPFQLQNVTEGFIRFFQAGIEPTGETLTAFGNLAAGMGKDITQLAQATFNATTGEMEMLKQFGIKAKQMGDEVEFTFEGQTTTVEKTGEAIGEFIRNLGETRFPTALQERLATMSGSFSNLKDKASIFANEIGEAGLTEAMTNLANVFQDVVSSAGEGGLADVLGKTLKVAVDVVAGAVQLLDAAFKKIGETFDAIGLAIDKFDLKVHEFILGLQEGFNEGFFGNFFKVPVDETIANIDRIKAKIMEGTGPFIPKPSDDKDENTIVGTIDPKANQNIEETTDSLISMTKAFDDMKPALIESSQAFTGEFVDALMNGQNALEGFKDFAKSLVSQIITTFMQLTVVNTLLNSIFNLTGDDALTTLKFGKAGGGRVQAGVPTLVGERGAELFIPNTGGTIMNNMNTQNALGGGQPIVVNQSLNFATGVVPTVRAEVTKMLPQIADVTKGAVLESAMRGGAYARGLRRG